MEIILIIIILISSLSIMFLCIMLYNSRKKIISLKNELDIKDITNSYLLEKLVNYKRTTKTEDLK